MTDLVKLSKFMALILRHDPERFGVTLDAEGFATIDELLSAMRREMPDVRRAEIHAVVDTLELEKRRFTIVGDEIRANYGHSIDARIEHEPGEPPGLLYHGTHERALRAILSTGLRPMGRQYIHMTPDLDIALKVGARRGPPRLIEVDAARAHEEGTTFYKANRTFWLADFVGPQFLRPV